MAEIKYTTRMALTDLINGKNIDKVKEWAKGEIDKLDKKNAKRKAAEGEIKAENKPIAEAILSALANGSMLSVNLAKAIGQTTNKTNGVAGEMVKLGMLTKTKVKVKGKGDQTSYSLVVVDTPTADEDEVADTEEVAEDTAD
jgi:hypothetical protein